jgi:hypothetical protein
MKVIYSIIALFHFTSIFAFDNLDICREKLRILQPEDYLSWQFLDDYQDSPCAINLKTKKIIQFFPLYYENVNSLCEVFNMYYKDKKQRIIEENERYIIFAFNKQRNSLIMKLEWQRKLEGKALVWLVGYCASCLNEEETVKRLKNFHIGEIDEKLIYFNDK